MLIQISGRRYKMLNSEGTQISNDETRIMSAREGENYGVEFKERNPNAKRMTYEEFQVEMRKIRND